MVAAIDSGPAPFKLQRRSEIYMGPAFWVEKKSDRHIEMFVGETPVAKLDYFEHGYPIMREVERAFRATAKALGAEVKDL